MAKLKTIKERVARDEQVVDRVINDPDTGAPLLAKDGTPATIGFVGRQSAARRAAEDEESRRLINMERDEMTPEEARARRVRLAAACCARWHGWEDDNDQPVPFSRENVTELLASDDRILDQAEKWIMRHGRFFDAPSASSAST